MDLCRERCTFNGVPPKVVITTREPYSFWRSLFTYAWAGQYAQVTYSMTGCPTSRSDHESSSRFLCFMRWASTQTRFRWGVSQSANIRTACGLAAVCGDPLSARPAV